MIRWERHFEKQPDLSEAYSAFMQVYVDLGHMEVVPENKVQSPNCYYFSDHPVFKKDTKKLRIVFNSS